MKRIWGQIKNNIHKLQFYLLKSDDLIINWSDYKKGLVLLVFGLMCQFFWLFWYLITLSKPELHIWLNLEFMPFRLMSICGAMLIYVCSILLCCFLSSNKTFRLGMGYFSPIFFGIIMLYNGFVIGIYSPATIAGLINLILVGLVLYPRKILYSIATPIVLIVVYLCYLTTTHQIRYAPLFSDELNRSEVYYNLFWLSSMAVLYLPVLFISALFFELLLSQWRRREKKVHYMSQVDALTDVYNRRFINETLSGYELQIQYAVVLLDLDHFKQINDQYGHHVGDKVLKTVASILKQHTRGGDTVGRYGGEEFILILRDVNTQQARDVAERCRKAIASKEIELMGNLTISISASFGVSVATDQRYSEDVIRLADEALYQAKAQGRNQVKVMI